MGEEITFQDMLLFVKTELSLAVQERDEYWKKQEMGKSDDCIKHCDEAVQAERERVRKWAITEGNYACYSNKCGHKNIELNSQNHGEYIGRSDTARDVLSLLDPKIEGDEK